MEQKLICYTEEESRKKDFMKDMLSNGWEIKQISSSSHGLQNVCWVLFEKGRPVNSAKALYDSYLDRSRDC